MNARFIVRMHDAEWNLLSWAEVQAEARPQGRPRSTPFKATGPTTFVIERNGVATQLSIHWADLDVVRRVELMEPAPVQVGQVFAFHWIQPVWIVEGSKVDIPLPPVTVRQPVKVEVPTGALNAITLR